MEFKMGDTIRGSVPSLNLEDKVFIVSCFYHTSTGMVTKTRYAIDLETGVMVTLPSVINPKLVEASLMVEP